MSKWNREDARDIVFRARVGSLDPNRITFEYLVALHNELNNWAEHVQQAITLQQTKRGG